MAKKVNHIVNVYEAEIKKYQKQLEALNKENKELAGQIDKAKKSMKDMDKQGSQLGGTLKKVGAQFAAAFAAQQLVRDAIKTIADFQQENARLASILGKTRSQITALSNDAKRLGASTAFTANEVSKLQTEFAKLGFTEREILNVTEATLQLAAATQSDLSQAAAIAGATVRGFNLTTEETQRVVDVMAKSFSSSALDLNKFEVGMRTVAPVAASAGVSIEQTTALLGVLSDRGLDASTAGTSLRNIFLELSAKGLTFNEAMEKINAATDRNAVALDLFGKRGSTAANIIAGAADDVANLNEKLESAAGTAQAMADEQLDTLSGSVTILKSAWDGLILSLEDGEGTLGAAGKSVVDFTTQVLSSAKNLNEYTGATNRLGEASEKAFSSMPQSIKIARRILQGMGIAMEKVNTIAEEQSIVLDKVAEAQKGTSVATLKHQQSQESLLKTYGLFYQLYLKQNANYKASSNSIEDLKERQAQLREELEKLPIGSPEFLQKQSEYVNVTNRLKSATSGLKNETKDLGEEAKTTLKVWGDLADELTKTAGMMGDFSADGVTVYDEDHYESDQERIDKFLEESGEEAEQRAKENIQAIEEQRQKESELAEQKKNQNEQINQGAVMLAAQAANRILDIKRAEAQNEYDAKMQSLQAQLAAEEITQEEYSELSAKALAKRNEQNKKAAIFQSIIDVAQATLLGLIQGGPALAAIYGGLAAAQAAIIRSLEIPAYKDGIIGIDGPGTETSDSILARLSKNESVIKAKGTKKHRRLLSAINDDSDRRINDVLMSEYILGNKELLSGLAFSQGRNDFDDRGMISALVKEGRAARKEQRTSTDRITGELRKMRTKNRSWYG